MLREDLLSCGTVLHLSELPQDGFSDQDIKNLVLPFGKVSDLIVLRSRNEVRARKRGNSQNSHPEMGDLGNSHSEFWGF
ncbi:hypothetical protein HGM15179_022279 [Zosterops borbonicus]|uniref:Uncharacterized protein n=1 Tax=Zosterops borbonicus TaxID=364589 RepID=A0A8K1D5L8_9PASS|nr:hypothetical protein HGM15179_022279 [Zosterops borbonicus]